MDNSFEEVFRYLRAVRKRRYLCLATSVAVCTAVVLFAYLSPAKYQADSTVFIETNVIKELVKGLAVTPEMANRVRVLKYAMLSRDTVTKVLKDLDVDTLSKGDAEFQELVSDLQLRTNIKVKGEKGGQDLFTVSIVDKDPKFAQDFINKLVRTYVEQNISAKREETYGANRFIDEQVVLFKSKLDAAENTIIDYRKKSGVFLSTDENSTLAEIKAYRKEIQDLGLLIEALEAKNKRLNQQLTEVDSTVSIYSKVPKENRVAALEAEIAKLLLNYTPNYPEVVRLSAELETLKKHQQGKVDPETEMTSTNPVFQDVKQKSLEGEAELSSLIARRRMLEKLVSDKELELQQIPETAKQLHLLTQERDSLKRIYEDLLLRMGQSEVSKQMEIGDKTTTFRIVDPALFPTKPVSPDKVKLLLLAMLGGLGAGVGLVILLDQMDSSIKEARDLEVLGLQVLASVPPIEESGLVEKRRKSDLLAYSLTSIYFASIFCLFIVQIIKKYV